MTAALQLVPTIDLAAELRSITERQHLNDVHYAVQLVRRAVAHGALHVDVRVKKRFLEVSHDGRTLDEEEHALLLTVCDPDAQDRQAALTRLERQFGVALLSVMTTAARVELTGRRALTAERGWVRAGRPTDLPGWTIRVHRQARSLREERSELRFYCKHARLPIHVDGRRVNAAFALDDAFLARELVDHDGGGALGIPVESGLARVRYFKHGIYFGLRRSLPIDGRPVEAVFDSTLPGEEDNFHDSVKAANRAVATAKDELYRDLAAGFSQMTPAERARVREIVLGLGRRQLTPALAELPILSTSATQWRLSLRDVTQLAGVRGWVPYLRRARGDDDELPVLAADDVAAVSRLSERPVRHALSFTAGTSFWRRWRAFWRSVADEVRPRRAPSVIPPDRLSPDVRALIGALGGRAGGAALRIVDDGPVHVERSERGAVLYVPQSDPLLRDALDRFASAPDELDAIGASLLLADS